jgi:hypothetical protein
LQQSYLRAGVREVKDTMKQPMLCSVLFILFSLCSRVLSSSAIEYGVGFNLALDYG